MLSDAAAIDLAMCDICGSSDAEPMFEENGVALVRCTDCGHFFVPSVPTHALDRPTMEEQPPPSIHQRNELSRLPIFEEYVREVKKHTNTGHWLDLGCGCGTLMTVAQREGFHPLGIETDPERLAFCQAANLTVHAEELGADSFKPGSFDVISLVNVFSHLFSPTATFEAMDRILKPGGTILVATSECGKTAYKDEVTSWHIPDHLHFAGPTTLYTLASRCGLDLSYAKRELSQKVILSEKLVYDSKKSLLRVLKLLLRRVPGLVELAARLICLKRGYHEPRQEIVAILRKPVRRKAVPRLTHG